MAQFTRQNLIAPVGALAAAIAVAGTALLLPAATLEDLVWQSGIGSILPVAQPPLGVTARAVLALTGGGVAAAVGWSALFLLFGPGGFFAPATDETPKAGKPHTMTAHAAKTRAAKAEPARDGVPVLRKADAHPDHPARKPLSASDLGAPMPPVAAAPVATAPIATAPIDATPIDTIPFDPAPFNPAPIAAASAPLPAGEPIIPPYIASIERDLPRDLDEPLAAFDPAALPDVPMAPVPPVAPLRMPVALAKGERIETVQLPMPRDGAELPSIESLLRRLEQGARPRRAAAG